MTLDLEDRHWWYRGRRQIIREVISSLGLPAPAQSLDAGCGGGATLGELAEFGPVVGVEPDPAALQAARAREIGEVVEGSLESLPFEPGRFDLVTAFDVIEHLDDDVAGLRELRRVAKHSGFLVVTVPAYPRLWSVHDVVNEHRRRYVRNQLVGAASKAGWTQVYTSYFNSLLFAPAAASRVIQRMRSTSGQAGRSDFERTPGWADRPLTRVMAFEARMVRQGRRLPMGLSLIGAFAAADGPETS